MTLSLSLSMIRGATIAVASRFSSDEETFRARLHVKLKEIMLQVNLDEVTSKFVILPSSVSPTLTLFFSAA